MKAKYLGLDLSSPVVVSSSPYTATVSNIEQCVRNGAGAVVLKSIFEEQIIRHAAALDYASQQGMGDSGEYLERYIGDAYKGEFLKLVADARTTGVPVIASINCIASAEAWTDYAVSMEQAGAAALELNIFLQPTDRHRSAQELEQEYADVVRRVAEAVKIPVSVKLPMRLTNVLAVADSLLARGARGVVMFNRFFEPDIDVERMTFVNGDPFSEPAELRNERDERLQGVTLGMLRPMLLRNVKRLVVMTLFGLLLMVLLGVIMGFMAALLWPVLFLVIPFVIILAVPFALWAQIGRAHV